MMHVYIRIGGLRIGKYRDGEVVVQWALPHHNPPIYKTLLSLGAM